MAEIGATGGGSDTRHTPPPGRGRRARRAARRWAVRVARIVAIALGVIVLVIVATIGTPAGRRIMLRRGLATADRILPGSLAVARADWPTLSRIDLRGAVWTDRGDTVLAARRVMVDLNPVALLDHQLVLRELVLTGVTADPARLKAALPTQAPIDTTRQPQPGKAPFLRPGAIPPFPSIAIGHLHVSDVVIRMAGRPPVRLEELAGSLDLRGGGPAQTDLSLRAAPMPQLGVSWAFHASLDDTLRLQAGRVDLVRLRGGEGIPQPAPAKTGGRLTIPRASLAALGKADFGAVTADLDSLAIGGAAGQYVLSARLSPPRAGLRLAADWPAAPRGLIETFLPAGLSPGRRADLLGLADSLAAGWPHDPAPRTRLALDIRDLPGALAALRRHDHAAAFAASGEPDVRVRSRQPSAPDRRGDPAADHAAAGSAAAVGDPRFDLRQLAAGSTAAVTSRSPHA